MIRSIVRTFHWSAKKIDKLYYDDNDYHGLIFWYDDVVKTDKEVRAAYKKP